MTITTYKPNKEIAVKIVSTYKCYSDIYNRFVISKISSNN